MLSKRVLLSLLISLLTPVVKAAVVAAPSGVEVNSLAEDFAETKRKIEDAEVKQRQVLSALYQLNKKIKKTVVEKGDLSQKRVLLEINIRELTDKVEELEGRSQAQRLLLSQRLRAIYKLGGPSIARFLFSSENAANLDRNLKILGAVATRDVELIQNYRHDLQELQQKKKTLSLRLESHKKIEDRIAQQENQFRQDQALKGKLLNGIRRSKLFALNKIQNLREKSLQYNFEDEGLFDLLFKPSFADQKGQLPSPLRGMVTQKFGLIKGEEHRYALSHKGVFIAAAKGSPISSVFSGKVSYVGEVPGFGKTLILDHGDHYYSVYSHTDDIRVEIGEEITQSQIIAKVADSTP
ncbi:MAG: peptidoglycan DD-metalloendopeptidase family protein, partial [Bdellovibrio sp.]